MKNSNGLNEEFPSNSIRNNKQNGLETISNSAIINLNNQPVKENITSNKIKLYYGEQKKEKGESQDGNFISLIIKSYIKYISRLQKIKMDYTTRLVKLYTGMWRWNSNPP